MELLWADGFELPSTADVQARYESVTAIASASQNVRTNLGIDLGGGSLQKQFSRGYQKIAVGIAHLSSAAQREFIILYDSAGNVQLTLAEKADGTWNLYRGTFSGGTLLATSAVVTTGVVYYIELLVTISATVGAYELRINEVSMFSAANVNTRNGAYDDIQRVTVNGRLTNGGTINCYVDDFVIYDAITPFPNSTNYFPGNCKVECLIPSGPGSVTGWAKFNDSNFKNVDERPKNDDTDYNYSGIVNASDLYAMSNMSSSSGSIRGVQLTYAARKEDVLTRATRPLIRTGGVTYAGSNDSLTTSYVYYDERWTFNPQTASDWTIAEINSIEAGIQTTS